jgi:hypothetical protein
MPKSYSADLRKRVIETVPIPGDVAHDSGMMSPAIPR